MITWNNLDTIPAYQELLKTASVNLAEAMAGEKGAERVRSEERRVGNECNPEV